MVADRPIDAMSDTPTLAPPPLTPPRDELALSFDGKTWDYFRVWLVAYLLTLITFGIFSPWAEIRRERFIYEHTRLGKTPFEYRAQPLAVFKVWLLTSLLPSAWFLAMPRVPAAAPCMFAVWALVWPWLAVYGARAEVRRISHAGRQLELSLRYVDVLNALLWPFGLGFFLLLPFGLVRAHTLHSWESRLVLVAILAVVLGAFLQAGVRVANVACRSASLGSLRCEPHFRVRDALWLVANGLLGLVSLGLLSPWAELRSHRRRLSRLRVIAEPELTTELDLDRTWA